MHYLFKILCSAMAAVSFMASGVALAASSKAAPALPAHTVSLRESVEATLAHHPTIKAMQEYHQAAEHDLKRARSGWFPRVDARAGYGYEQWSDENTRLHKYGGYRQSNREFYTRSEASLTISQTIWDGMATKNRVRMHQTRLDSAESRLYDNVEALGLDAVLAHIEIYRQRRIVALAELNVKNHKSILASQHERHRSGASTMADVTQTESRLARTEASLTESRQALDNAISNYKKLTGAEPGAVEPPVVPGNAYPSLEACLIRSQFANPKIKTARSDIETQEAQAGLDKSAFSPTIYLEAGPTYTYQSGSSLDDQGGMQVMLKASWNLFNGGYDWFNVKGSLARARQMKQELNATIDALTEETEKTWTELMATRDLAKHYADAVDYSTKTRDMYLEQFNVGQRSLLDVLDSENELFSYSIQLVTAQQNIIATQYRLLALGGDFLASFKINRHEMVVSTEK